MLASLTTPIGKIFQPLLDFVGSVLAFFFSIIPNYPVDVALLTIVIMAALTPLTVKSTKNMAAMQALGPEMKKLQQKYKGPENRAQMNEEMMKLYKEHNVNPASGCLPMLLQMPSFFVLYSVIRGITNTVTIPAHTLTRPDQEARSGGGQGHPPVHSRSVEDAHGHRCSSRQVESFGLDFAQKLLSHHSSIWVDIPYLLLVLGRRRTAVPADVPAERPESAGRTRRILRRRCCRNTCLLSSVLFTLMWRQFSTSISSFPAGSGS